MVGKLMVERSVLQRSSEDESVTVKMHSIAAAGVYVDKPFLEHTPEDLDLNLDVNVSLVSSVARRYSKLMLDLHISWFSSKEFSTPSNTAQGR